MIIIGCVRWQGHEKKDKESTRLLPAMMGMSKMHYFLVLDEAEYSAQSDTAQTSRA